MLEKIKVKNMTNDKIYEGFCEPNNADETIYFTKKIAKQIIEENNETNRFFNCDVSHRLDGPNKRIICEDNEFSNQTDIFESYMKYTTNGLTRLYVFGSSIIWEKV